MNITVLIPTRDRQKLLPNAVATLLNNCVLEGTRVVVGWDNDEMIGPDGYRVLDDPRVRFSTEPREDTLGAKYNRIAARDFGKSDVFVLWADDMTIATPGWDKAIAQASALFTDGIGIVFFGKLEGVLQPGIAVTRGMVNAIGELCDPSYAFWYQDTRLIELGRMTSRIVEISGIGVKILDQLKGNSRGVRDLSFWGQFFDATRPDRIAIAERIIDQCNDQPFRKYQLKQLLPSWAEIFRRTNSKCADPIQAKQLEAHYSFDAPASERYLRAKARAQGMLAGMQKAAA